MKPVYADFSAEPPRLGNAEWADGGSMSGPRGGGGGGGGSRGGDHLKLGNGQSVRLAFEVGAKDIAEQVTLTVTALSSKLGPDLGRSPLTVTVNDHDVVRDLTIPGGGDLPQELSFAVPGQWLRAGETNRVVVANGADAATYLWLYRITMEDVFDRGAAKRALESAAAGESVFVYRTELRAPDDASWTTGPRLLLHVDCGEDSLPAQVSWTSADGAESGIGFQSSMSDFLGWRRDSDGTTVQLRGFLSSRQAYPGGLTADDLLRFETEVGWGGAWHKAETLRIALDDGGRAVRRIGWRDQRGDSASISLQADRTGFLGCYQRYNEGPIGYRGQLAGNAGQVPMIRQATGEDLRKELELLGKHAVGAAEQLAGKVTGWWRNIG